MKKFAMIAALALMFGAPVFAQAKTEEKPAAPKEEPKKDEAKADGLKPYRTKGNTWTLKTTAKYGSFEVTSFIKYEVTEVTEEKATVKQSILDKDEKEQSSSTFDVPFKAAETPKETPKEPAEAPKVVEETIKVAAGEYKCTKTEMESGGSKTTTWIAKDTYILVKSTSKSDMGESTTELIKAEIK
ncbi:MAG: hypothetical protein IPP14_06640 [Planctomycetes bacterium]|nr:hypothetical protein [Planctomycetota bacterium]